MKTFTLLATLLLSETPIHALVLSSPIDRSQTIIQTPLLDSETPDVTTNVSIDIPLRCNESRCNTCRRKNHCGPGLSWYDPFSPLWLALTGSLPLRINEMMRLTMKYSRPCQADPYCRCQWKTCSYGLDRAVECGRIHWAEKVYGWESF
jgi:hypothetical protein